MLVPVIFFGGACTYFWFLVLGIYPKQLLPPVNGTTMLNETMQCLANLPELGESLGRVQRKSSLFE